jgi:transposase
MVSPDSSTTAGSRSTQALQRIAALYRMETDIRGRGPDKRRVVRQERLRPLLAELEPWLREKLTLCEPEE